MTAVPIPITHTNFIYLTTRAKGQGRGAIGLDLPTWFYQSAETPFIMIVTQDRCNNIHIYNYQHFSNLIGTRGILESGREISVNSTLYPSNI